MGGNAEGKTTIGLVIPSEIRSAVHKPKQIWISINNIFQGLYDLCCDNGLIDDANELLDKYPLGKRVCVESFPES
ncbi:MAG: hypothetical protein ACTSPK_00075 [Candidatus Heimdallarchaeota archaeon]